MKRFIFGITDLAQNLMYNLKLDNIKIDGFLVEQKYMSCDCFKSYPVYCWEDFQHEYISENCGIYICIGYTAMNSARKRIFNEVAKKGYRILEYVSPQACIMSEVRGEGCLIFEGSYLGPYTNLGKGNILYPRCILAHHTIAGDFNYFAISASVAGKVKIGNECFFGNNSYTKDKINIGDRVLVGAGAYAYRDIENDAVVMAAKSVIKKDKKSTEYL